MAFNQYARQDNEQLKFLETDDGNVAVRVVGSSGSTSLDVTTSSVDSSSLIGSSSSNANFTTAYASATTITISNLPSTISALETDDIVSIEQYTSAGTLVKKYTRDDATISITGSTITVVGASFSGTDSFVVYTNLVASESGNIAETTIPTAVSDGETVNIWFDEYGRQISHGSNLSVNAQDTNQVNQALLNTSECTDLSAVTATGASTEVNAQNYNKLTYHIVATGVSSGATIEIQHSLNGTNWVTLNTTNISSTGNTEVYFSDVKYKYMRANVTSYSDGTYTVLHLFGN